MKKMGEDSLSPEARDYYNRLLEESGEAYIHSSSLVMTTDTDIPPSLTNILGIAEEEVSPVINNTIEVLERGVLPNHSEWINFKWRLWAFFEIQDIFDSPLMKSDDELSFLRIWYFYYESKYLLIESILSGLSGHYHSAALNQRPFLEFSVLQCYKYRKSNTNSSYKEFEVYLKNGRKPKWSSMLKGAFPKDNFSKVVRERLDMHYKALSNHYAHPYLPLHSSKGLTKRSYPRPSLEGIMTFWRQLDIVIQPVLWMYYVNFPMIFFPKNLLEKFGFNPPMGIFIDKDQAHIFKNSLSEQDYNEFYKYAEKHEDVLPLQEWFESYPKLSEEGLMESWNVDYNGPFPESIEVAKLHTKAKIRSTREAMSLAIDLKEGREKIKNVPDLDLSFMATRERYNKAKQEKKKKKK